MEYISSLDGAYNLPEKGRKVSILGSTGSIGQTTLKVIEQQRDTFQVIGLAGGENVYKLAQQANKFQPQYLCVKTQGLIKELKEFLSPGYRPEILSGPEGYKELATLDNVHIIVQAQSGAAGLIPTIKALEHGKVVALANKESLVLAGPIIKRICKDSNASILPIDSEHNAIFQIIILSGFKGVKKIILTASGGPFFGKNTDFLKTVTPKMALSHPNWSMGAKISIDSATLMNKGLEVIEAHYLYGAWLDEIGVIIHRESIVHSMVEFQDGGILAQMGVPDMALAIGYTLSFPNRPIFNNKELDLCKFGRLSFFAPDNETFPMLSLAIEALKMGESYPIVLNASNEVAVDAFLIGRISFLDIIKLNKMVLESHKGSRIESVEDILEVDSYARLSAQRLIERL